MSVTDELAGQVAIVTGASRGVGRAIALALAARGADLVLVGRDAATLQPLAARLGGRARAVACDVTSGAEIVRLLEEVRTVFQYRIDVLVNAVGGTGGLTAPVWEIAEPDFTRILTLNLTSSFLTMSAVLPLMIARRHGRIINIGGTYGLRGRAGRAAYSAAKWGLRGLTRSAALEAGPFNVTVNCVCPGLIEGPVFDDAAATLAASEGISAAAAKAGLAEAYPLRRISTPEDVAHTVCFLAGEGGRQITGQDLAVDGGWTS